MISPHAVARTRALFTMAVDADRARRLAGLPEPEHEVGTQRPMAGYRLTDVVASKIQMAVQASVFSGG